VKYWEIIADNLSKADTLLKLVKAEKLPYSELIKAA